MWNLWIYSDTALISALYLNILTCFIIVLNRKSVSMIALKLLKMASIKRKSGRPLVHPYLKKCVCLFLLWLSHHKLHLLSQNNQIKKYNFLLTLQPVSTNVPEDAHAQLFLDVFCLPGTKTKHFSFSQTFYKKWDSCR